VLEGRTLHLSDGTNFDGAAWDVRPPLLTLTLTPTPTPTQPQPQP
jgi:hypothetical protein